MNGQNRWLYLIKRMVYRFFDDGIPQSAAELSYFLLFSMFPLLMFVNSMLAQLDRLARSDGFIRFDHALKYLRQQGALHEIILWFYHAMSVLPKKTLVFFTLIYHTISIHRAQENN